MMPEIPIEDAIEIIESEGYEVPSYPEGIMLEVPNEFTLEELYEMVLELSEEEKQEKYNISRRDLLDLSFYARHLKRIKEKYPDWVVIDVDVLFDRIGLFGGRKNTYRNAKMTVKESRFFEDMSNAIAMSIAYNNNSLIKNVLIGYSELFEDDFVEQVIKFISNN